MSTLAQIRTRLQVMLMDTGAAIWDTATLDQAVRNALKEYTAARPLHMETVITLPGDGREIALSSISNLISVTEVWWPYDSAATEETWPPNRVRGYRLFWDDAQPVLFIDITDGDQPQEDDELRLWYTTSQTIQDLDSAAVTTLQPDHEEILIIGAAGHAAMSRVADLLETAGSDMYAVGLMGTWANQRLREFRAALKDILDSSSRLGVSWGEGWQLDKWDESPR